MIDSVTLTTITDAIDSIAHKDQELLPQLVEGGLPSHFVNSKGLLLIAALQSVAGYLSLGEIKTSLKDNASKCFSAPDITFYNPEISYMKRARHEA